jgi:hypothetical protein
VPAGVYPRRSFEERFWAKVDRRGPGECWPWLASKDSYGYGMDRRDGRTTHAHRISYELLVGPIPPGLVLDHFRLNPGPRQAPCSRACVNPSHAEPATNAENVLRGGGITATHARKTRCPGGHVYDKKRRGGRACRRCLALASRKHYALKHRKETR